ncbi:unnamed protein product [Nezara viridula]|uniref:Uncharacterized protein n=1 Tax=Nezara viridula TaxID=85310 RepID=A0A9P0MN53_NEZVI|nr:unnamed protein product [Nezara viridula]
MVKGKEKSTYSKGRCKALEKLENTDRICSDSCGIGLLVQHIVFVIWRYQEVWKEIADGRTFNEGNIREYAYRLQPRDIIQHRFEVEGHNLLLRHMKKEQYGIKKHRKSTVQTEGRSSGAKTRDKNNLIEWKYRSCSEVTDEEAEKRVLVVSGGPQR